MSAPRSLGLDASFASLQNRQYRRLWFAGVFSFMSVQMQFLLRGILAWDLTEREGALGLVYLIFGASMLVSTPLGGVASDRFPKKRVLIFSQVAILAAAVGMGLAILFGVEQFWMLMVAAVAHGTAFGFFGPSRLAITTELVGREHLGNAISLSLLSMNGTRIFAPALAGILAGVAFVGIGGAYLISAVSSIASLVFLLGIPEGAPPSPSGRNPFVEIADGVRYVRARPELSRIMVASFFVIMFGFNYVAFVPALVKGTFDLGDSWVGYLSSASALGAVLVSIPLAARADSPRARSVMTTAGILFGLMVILLGVTPNFWLALPVIAVLGAVNTTFQTLSNTQALALTSDEFQGRVQSLFQLSFAGFGLAALPLGLLAEAIGLRGAIVTMGAVASVAILTYKATTPR